VERRVSDERRLLLYTTGGQVKPVFRGGKEGFPSIPPKGEVRATRERGFI